MSRTAPSRSHRRPGSPRLPVGGGEDRRGSSALPGVGDPGNRPAPTLAGEVRGTALLFALAVGVTVGAAAAARVLAGLAP